MVPNTGRRKADPFSLKTGLHILGAIALLLLVSACSAQDRRQIAAQVTWSIDSLESIGGHDVTVLGAPRVIETAQGRAVEFDGEGDGLLLDLHPLEGLTRFTVEIVFRPAADGPREQRFFHMQEEGSKDRVMFETRLTGDGQWFLDSYIKSRGEGYTLFAKRHKHAVGPWYHAALVVDGEAMWHYVNGVQELSRSIDFRPPGSGRTSIGVRITREHWYRGAIRLVRFTPWVLSPEEFVSVRGL